MQKNLFGLRTLLRICRITANHDAIGKTCSHTDRFVTWHFHFTFSFQWLAQVHGRRVRCAGRNAQRRILQLEFQFWSQDKLREPYSTSWPANKWNAGCNTRIWLVRLVKIKSATPWVCRLLKWHCVRWWISKSISVSVSPSCTQGDVWFDFTTLRWLLAQCKQSRFSDNNVQSINNETHRCHLNFVASQRLWFWVYSITFLLFQRLLHLQIGERRPRQRGSLSSPFCREESKYMLLPSAKVKAFSAASTCRKPILRQSISFVSNTQYLHWLCSVVPLCSLFRQDSPVLLKDVWMLQYQRTVVCNVWLICLQLLFCLLPEVLFEA